jgi:protein transport protein SEC24
MEGSAPASQGPPLPTLAETDMNIKCDPKFLRTTVGKILNSQAAATGSKVPLGIICSPMSGDVGTANELVDVVDFGQTGIVRCKRCRTYINPFASWTDNGRKWRCNICGMMNETHHSYFCHLDQNGRRTDRDERPELSKCSVEFVAPNDYMVRAPQPPVYFFVIDVSSHSASSGMLTACCAAIKASLDDLPGKPRTQIGFITFDTAIHFYSLKASLAAPQMLVVSDTSDIIVPLPDDLLVDLGESRAVVETLLDSLPSMFVNSTAVQTCTGPALSAAKRVIQHIGGKLCLFQSSLPTLGEGALKNRENPKILGTDKEHNLLNAEDPWYKENAVDFSRLQVAVDTFLFSGQFTDLATLSVLSKYTSGSCYFYPMFSLVRDGQRFERELQHTLTRPTAFEAVMRVRCSRGLRLSNYYGNYFIRGNDLLALPNCTSDSAFAIDLQYEDSFLSSEVVTVQAALLYTSSAGERRIRVHTMVLPVTQSASEMVFSMDTYAAVNLLAKQSVEVAAKLGFQSARDQIQQTCAVMWRNATSRGPQGPYGGGYQQQQQPQGEIEVPPPLQFLPVYAMALQKNPALRGGQDVRLDERAFYHQRLLNMDVDDSKVFIYPRLFRIDDMTDDVGLASDNPDDPTPTAGPFRVRLPGTCSLTYKALLIEGISNGIFLLENGVEMLFRVGRSVNPNMIHAIFGVPSLEGVDLGALQIQSDSCDFAFRLNAVITALRAERGRHMQLKIIKESDGSAEAYFARYLVEDRYVCCAVCVDEGRLCSCR